MKKFKIFVLVLMVSVVSCFSLLGCVSGGAHFVSGTESCTKELDYFDYYNYSFNFDVKFTREGSYTIVYEIYMLDDNKEETYKIKSYSDCEITEDEVGQAKTIVATFSNKRNWEETNVKVRNVNIIKNKENEELIGIGIGFGVVAVAAVAGLVFLFIAEKKKNK